MSVPAGSEKTDNSKGGCPVPSGPTIGIVTARPEEYTATAALLDETSRDLRDDSPSRSGEWGDRCGRWTYRTGTMPSARRGVAHAVVVTAMTGVSEDVVATSTTRLLHRFPTIGLVVVCGIAAAVPGRNQRTHVAVGDIVVARRGFAVDDDLQTIVNGMQLRSRALGPSRVLAVAADMLMAAQASGARPWEAWLEPGVRGLPVGFRRPEEPPCPPDTPRRRGRPTVHYGRVASAARSAWAARQREDLADRHDLHAMELAGRGMQTASFPDGLEWFVVRGIAEDATEATDRDWRPAAALAAAAVTRALLGACPPLPARTVTAPSRPPVHVAARRIWRSGCFGRRLHGLHPLS
jgi:nucleoside phosphorylase